MTKSFTLLFFFPYIFFNTFAQAPVQWTKCYGSVHSEWGNAVQQTTDGGYVIAGVATLNGGDVSGSHCSISSCANFWVIKTDSSGQIQWQKCLGGSWDDWASSVKQTQDGGYIVAGSAISPDGDAMCIHCANGNPDFLIIKLDANGNIQWHNCYGGSNSEQPNAVVLAQDSGYLITGFSTSNSGDVSGNHGLSDFWLLKLDYAGNLLWQKTYGGSGDDIGNTVIQTSDGGYILAGSSTSSDGDVAQNHGAKDFWIVKTNNAGQIMWEKNFGGTGNDMAYSLSETNDGGFIAAGTSDSQDGDITGNHGSTDYWLVKISSTGLLQWEKSLGGSNTDEAYGIFQTPDGNYIAGGTSYSKDGDLHWITVDAIPSNYWVYGNAWIVKLDTSGNIIWESCYGGTYNDILNCIAPTSDGGLCMTGFTQTNNNGDVSGFHGSRDVWFVKLSPVSLINIQAAVCIQCNGVAEALPFAGTPPYEYLWSNGDTNATTSQLCPGVSTLTVTDAAGISSSGYFRIPFVNDFSLFMTQIPASCYACPDGSATVHTTGGNGFHYVWDGFPDTTATLSGQPRGWVKCCVTDSLGCVLCDSIEILSPIGISGSTSAPSFFIYPNPSTSTFTLVSADAGLKEIEIYNLTGQQVYRADVTQQITEINLTELPKGVYFVNAAGNTEKKSYTKIIIQ